MKRIIILLLILQPLVLFAQETQSKFSFEFGLSGNRYQYGETGFAVSNGLNYQINEKFSATASFQFAYGFYRYFQNQYEPSFVEARYISLQLPVNYKLPGKLSFLNIGLGPALTFRSRFENDSFKVNTIAGTTRIYMYDNGYMYNTLYAGMLCQLEAVVFSRNRITVKAFAHCQVYFNPFLADYFGAGIRSSFKL